MKGADGDARQPHGPVDSGPTVRLLVGHVIDQLRTLPDASIQTCVTSPPYWGLRDYSRCGCATKREIAGGQIRTENATDHDARNYREKAPDPDCPKCHGTGKDDSLTVVWDARGGCEHEWGLEIPRTHEGGVRVRVGRATRHRGGRRHRKRSRCERPAMAVAIPREHRSSPTPDLYVKHIVQVFRDVWRVMRDDGSLWCNMGDSYASGELGRHDRSDEYKGEFQSAKRHGPRKKHKMTISLKPKDLVGMPWRVAFALQADGWYLRSDIVWSKPNPMPESVTDRPTKAHEYVFLMTKNARYFYDADAVRENTTHPELVGKQQQVGYGDAAQTFRQDIGHVVIRTSGRNLRSVWTIPTAPYPEAHFATFPPRLVEPCIKAGTSEKGCCATCGAAWERVVDSSYWSSTYGDSEKEDKPGSNDQKQRSSEFKTRGFQERKRIQVKTLGFRPTCDHGGDPVPCVVLDPFAGSGTVGQVARALGRSAILIDIKSEYAELARKRIDMDHKALYRFAEPITMRPKP